AGATPVRGVVDRPVDVGGMVADVVASQLEHARVTGLAEQAGGAERVDDLGKDREDVDPHGASRSSSNSPSGGSMTTTPSAWRTTNTTGTRAPDSSSNRSDAGLATTATHRPRSRPWTSVTIDPISSCTHSSSG